MTQPDVNIESEPRTSNGAGDIVVGVDGSEESFTALQWALREASLSGRAVNAVYAWTHSWDMGAQPDNPDAWEKASMGTYMLNSVIVTALALLLLIVISLPAAYVLSRFKFKTSKFWNVLFMAGLFINVSYIVVPIFLMLNNWDKTLRQLTGGTFFLNNLFVLALVYASTALPFTIYLLSGYFRSLAKDFEEAAYVDGASYFTTMVKIIFPMAKPSIVTVILFSFLSFWNEYIISMTLLTKPELKTLPVGLMNLMAAQKSAVQYGQMYAGLVIVMLPTLILYICVQKKLTQGMTLGGLKG